jgi:hypothetical protein
MKKILKAASILTWFNMIVWSFFVLLLLALFLFSQAMIMLFLFVLLSSIPLNCYAALQLHKSIRRPTVKLSSQTPTGIRFVGFVALFLAITTVINDLTLIGNAREAVKLVKDGMVQVKNAADLSYMTVSFFRIVGIIGTILGLCVGANVLLNFRLLRWYYLVSQSDIRQSDDVRQNDEP